MGRGELVRQIKYARHQACGIGTRALKLRLNKLAKTDPLAQAARLALELEDVNINAKRYGPSYADHYYARKGELIREMIALCRAQGWVFGVHPAARRFERSVIYFELPGCAQVSWHYDHEGEPLPIYEKEWDGQRGSTLPKLLSWISSTFLI